VEQVLVNFESPTNDANIKKSIKRFQKEEGFGSTPMFVTEKI